MLLGTYPVRIEEPAETLDNKQIVPAEFKTIAAEDGKVALDIRFRSEEHAKLFERAFA
jgi:hypothetical protein